ncbi:Uncharacterised protein [Vibrio cholerae]|nr:Uncharacterised protein [Vibrio cholerae]
MSSAISASSVEESKLICALRTEDILYLIPFTNIIEGKVSSVRLSTSLLMV